MIRQKAKMSAVYKQNVDESISSADDQNSAQRKTTLPKHIISDSQFKIYKEILKIETHEISQLDSPSEAQSFCSSKSLYVKSPGSPTIEVICLFFS